jgi:cathepsin B
MLCLPPPPYTIRSVRTGCGGGFPTTAWARLEQHGLVTGGQNNGLGPFGNSSGFCSSFSLPHCHHYGPRGDDPYPAEGGDACPKVTTGHGPACPTACDTGARAPHADFASDKYKYSGKQEHYSTVDALRSAIMTFGPVETTFSVYADFETYAGGIYHKTTGHSLGGHAVRLVGWGVENGTAYWKVANSWNPFWGERGYFRIVRGTNECGIESGAVSSASDAKWSGPGI